MSGFGSPDKQWSQPMSIGMEGALCPNGNSQKITGGDGNILTNLNALSGTKYQHSS